MRLVPYLDITSTTPADELIRLNSARLDLAQKAGFAEVDRRGQAVVGAAARSPVRAVVAGVRSGGAHAAGRARRKRDKARTRHDPDAGRDQSCHEHRGASRTHRATPRRLGWHCRAGECGGRRRLWHGRTGACRNWLDEARSACRRGGSRDENLVALTGNRFVSATVSRPGSRPRGSKGRRQRNRARQYPPGRGNEGARFRRPREVARLPPMAGSVGRTTWALAACGGSR
jgi:hypothetical protein